ncbi:MAG: hypothetical protein RQ856_00410, partial [Candidatus Izemoplasmatales bacterium]|nr:hypothetical protein [Candidatus Izemoplasmatales bacterium]
ILHMTVIISVLFALAMGFFSDIDSLLFVFVSVFIFPVIIHSIILFIEREEDSPLPVSLCESKIHEVIIAKILAAITLHLVPFILYILVMLFVLDMNFSIMLFLLTYLLGLIIHVTVGLVITIISKTHVKMLLMYVGYIILFSFLPFISLMNYIRDSIQYLFIFSPAYLSGILFQNIIFGYLYSEQLLVILAIILQLLFSGLLIWFFIKPFYQNHINKVCEIKHD